MRSITTLKRQLGEYLHNHAEAERQCNDVAASLLQDRIDDAMLDMRTHQLRLAALSTRIEIAIANARMADRGNDVWALEAEQMTICEDLAASHHCCFAPLHVVVG